MAFGGPAGGPSASGNDSLQPKTQIKMVDRITVHPKAKMERGFFSNDVALIELLDPFNFNTLVNAVCIAETEPKLGQLCVTAGWSGVKKEGSRRTNSFCFKKLLLFFFIRCKLSSVPGLCPSPLC